MNRTRKVSREIDTGQQYGVEDLTVGVAMAIEPVLTNLRAKLSTISAGSKADFLSAFADIHDKWHMSEMRTGKGKFGGKQIGFLAFHHEVLTVYQGRYATSLTPGTMANPLPAYRAAIDSAVDAVSFSHAIEDWHNSVHRNVAKYGVDFSDPTKNIYMPRFWQLHKLIDTTF